MANLVDTARPLFVTGLKDAHALEHQALALMDRQIERLKNYPDVEARLRSHRKETEEQITRLQSILGDLGESHSTIKDAVLSVTGNLAAIAHTIAGDEIIKNSFANFAFENFEVASYTGLITLAEAAEVGAAIPLLRQSLDEEQAMAQFVIAGLPAVTQRFLTLRAAGDTASH